MLPRMKLTDLAARLSAALDLTRPPIAVAFTDTPPAGVPRFDGSVPGGCSFWELAGRAPLATVTRDHELCSIGVHTHRLRSPSALHERELARALEVMASLDYVDDEAIAGLPVLERTPGCVVYAPLADSPLPPDAVLVFAHARQSLVVVEATHTIDGAAAPALGRPACAVIPQAVNTGRAALSLGCCGARAYLDGLTDGVALWALPGAKLAAYVAAIERFSRANATLGAFHRVRRADVEAGHRPSVDDSLRRLEQRQATGERAAGAGAAIGVRQGGP
jgi:uncharacterized protein (DUF169 family)